MMVDVKATPNPLTAEHAHDSQRELAEQARDAYAAIGEAKKADLTDAETWLANHPLP